MEDRDVGAASPIPPINWTALKDDAPASPDDQIADLLCSAEDVDSVGQAILHHTATWLERCILFTVQETTAFMWGARGIGIDREKAGKLKFRIDSEPIFKLFLGESHYHGPLPADPVYKGFYDMMQMDRPSELLIIPVHLQDRLVALFYGDCGTRFAIQGEAEDYRRLVRKLALALNLVVLKKKIQAL